jgi:ATP-binding cassette subfamily F protein 3
MLSIEGLSYRIAGRPILEDASAAIGRGWRVGLVGPNGAGKTTLLRLVLGTLHADAGEISVPKAWRIGTVAQEAPGGEATPIETVLAADTERSALLDEVETSTDGERIAEIHDRLIAIGADAAPARAGSILHGLGFDDAAQRRPLSTYSGGWRMRVALAGVLFARPDLLLLDEPTNHLDLEAAIWLEDYLKRYPATILMVSHDRGLLNAVPDHILHLDATALRLYAGNYDRFERTRNEALVLLEKQRAKQESERKRIQGFVDRFRAKATKARQAQSRLKALARLEPLPEIAARATIEIHLPDIDELASPILACEGVAVGYDGKAVLQGIDLSLQADDRIALLGANGNGKTTLARLLAGRLEPQGGVLAKSKKLVVGYFAQHQLEELDPARDALAHMSEAMPKAPPEKVRAFLGRFGFSGDAAEVPCAQLSGGEKARLALALIARQAPQLLILDEPTNHLDIDMRRALAEALAEFEGAVILVSHDPSLVDLIADRLWLVEGGRVLPFDGDMEAYRKRVLAPAGDDRARPDRPNAAGRREARRDAAELRRRLAPLRKRAQAAEAAVDRLSREQAEIAEALADPATYDGAPSRAIELGRRRGDVEKRLEAAEAEWLAASEALEAETVGSETGERP